MKITWLGHACFMLEYQGFRALLDPFQNVPGLKNTAVEADAVYCSHDHFDHAYTAELTLTSGKENPFTVRKVPSYHDAEQGHLRGANTIHVFTAGGVTVAHMGDLGHHLSPETVRQIGHCDAIMMPVGGVYTLDCEQAKEEADKLGATVVIPMHFRKGRLGFQVVSTLEEFVDLYPINLISNYPTNTVEITPGISKQLALLSLPESLLA